MCGKISHFHQQRVIPDAVICAFTGTQLQAGNGVGALGKASMGALPEPPASDINGGITRARRPHLEQLPAS